MNARLRTLAVILLCLIAGAALLAPLLSPFQRDEIDLDRIAAAPSPAHVLGTDSLGRDVLTRLLYGGRYTLLVAGLSVAVAACAGVVLGGAAGWFGGAVDRIVAGLVNLFLSIPVFLVLLVAAAAFGARLWTIPLLIGAMSWMETARIVRARFMQVRGEEFVAAARAAGAGAPRIVLRHLLPQAAPPVAVAATAGLANAMLVESALSYLGFGVQPPVPTWGNMLTGATLMLRSSPAAAIAPGLMIFVACFAFNMLFSATGPGLAKDRRP